jgi:hypothetical protein
MFCVHAMKECGRFILILALRCKLSVGFSFRLIGRCIPDLRPSRRRAGSLTLAFQRRAWVNLLSGFSNGRWAFHLRLRSPFIHWVTSKCSWMAFDCRRIRPFRAQ